MKLETCLIKKPWGRTELPATFRYGGNARIGEILFAGPGTENFPLLAKYIFTSERLSIQVHPNDAEARRRGLPSGKSEFWYIVDSEPGASLGLGLSASITRDALRAAALNGSIVELLNWVPVSAGDFFYIPAGTIHAIGGGIALVEFQQNSDATYRLYDFGRKRDLHIADGIAVALLEPYSAILEASTRDKGTDILLDGPILVVVRADGSSPGIEPLASKDRWILPLQGAVYSVGETAGVGECLFVPAHQLTSSDVGSEFLIGAMG